MQPTKFDRAGKGLRRLWQPPALTELRTGSETKSSRQSQEIADAQASGSAPAGAEPPPPAAPATKLGFSLEWAFPLASRWSE